MNIILVLIPVTLIFLIAAALIFFWAVNHGQFDDMDSPSILPMSDNLRQQREHETDDLDRSNKTPRKDDLDK